jgi:hypothetical protein
VCAAHQVDGKGTYLGHCAASPAPEPTRRKGDVPLTLRQQEMMTLNPTQRSMYMWRRVNAG